MSKSTKQIVEQVKSIILKHANPSRIYLFGSTAKGDAEKESDIDIAFDDPEFRKDYLIEEDLNGVETLKKIDVKNLVFTEERFRNRVKAQGKVIYSADKKLRAEDGLYNYKNALKRFVDVVERKDEFESEGFGDVYLDVVVKRFEFTYEMAWKALKRYLDFLGLKEVSPRMVFKEAFAQQIIEDEAVWLDMIEQRNLSSHIYNENELLDILGKLENYKQAFIRLEQKISTGLRK